MKKLYFMWNTNAITGLLIILPQKSVDFVLAVFTEILLSLKVTGSASVNQKFNFYCKLLKHALVVTHTYGTLNNCS